MSISKAPEPVFEIVDIGTLTPREGNPNEFTEEQMESLEYSMDRFGFLQPLVINQDNIIVDGAHRFEALREQGFTQIRVSRVFTKDENELKLLSQALNKIRGQHNLKRDISEMELLLGYNPIELKSLLGFDETGLDLMRQQLAEQEEETQRLFRGQQKEETEADLENLPMPEEIQEPITKTGDIWKLGRHTIVCGDCTNQQLDIKVDLLILDPPYNIDKAEWDNIENYMNVLQNWILKFQSVIKETGSCYIFHNQMDVVSKLMVWMEQNSELIFHQFIVWNKFFEGCKNHDYLAGYNYVNGLRNYQRMAEYILFYTLQDETGLSKVMLDINNFQPLRQYFKEFQNAIGLTLTQITDKLGRKAEHCFYWNSTQWSLPTKETYSELVKLVRDPNFRIIPYDSTEKEYLSLSEQYKPNNINSFRPLRQYFKQLQEAIGLSKSKIIELVGQNADHCFRWDSSQWDLPTKETYQQLIGMIKDPDFKIIPYDSTHKNYLSLEKQFQSLIQEYEPLRQQYESLRYIFNNQKTHHSVWNYDFDTKVTDIEHPTSKPVALMNTIVKYSSNKNDTVFDPFMGSGPTLISCEQTDRIFYGVENDPRYVDVAVQRWENYTNQKAELIKQG